MTEDIVGGRYMRLLGEKTGIIGAVTTVPPGRGDPPVYVSKPELTDIAHLGGESVDDPTASGKGIDIEQSILTALGEAVERYCCFFPPPPDELVHASYREVNDLYETIPFEYLDGFNLERHGDLDRSTKLRWAAGTNLLDGLTMYLPDSLAWLRVDRDERYVLSTSNGCATAQRLDVAATRSLLEVIERDGLMRTWCLQVPPVRVRGVPAAVRPLVNEFEERGYEVEFYRLASTVDVPVIGCRVRNHGSSVPERVFSCSAALSVADAMEDTLVEIGQGCLLAKTAHQEYDMDTINAQDTFDGPVDNFLYYACGDGGSVLEDLVDVEESVAVEAVTPPESRTALLDRLRAHSCRPILFDLTTPDVRDAGLFVTRVIVPELIPLSPPSEFPLNHTELMGKEVTNHPHPYA